MNTRNEIKITFGTPKHLIYGNFTKCSLPFEVKLPPMLELMANMLIDKGYIKKLPKSVKGLATIHPGDEYDEKKGLKISMAKAEISAYAIVNNWLADINDLFIDNINYKIDDFMIKADKVIEHDIKYIKQF